MLAASAYGRKYDQMMDRDSAAEILAARAQKASAEAGAAAQAAPPQAPPQASGGAAERVGAQLEFNRARRYAPGQPLPAPAPEREREAAAPRRSSGSASRSDSIAEVFGKSLARQLGAKAGQQIVRGVLGSLFKAR